MVTEGKTFTIYKKRPLLAYLRVKYVPLLSINMAPLKLFSKTFFSNLYFPLLQKEVSPNTLTWHSGEQQQESKEVMSKCDLQQWLRYSPELQLCSQKGAWCPPPFQPLVTSG